jgi:hypothetical protein
VKHFFNLDFSCFTDATFMAFGVDGVVPFNANTAVKALPRGPLETARRVDLYDVRRFGQGCPICAIESCWHWSCNVPFENQKTSGRFFIVSAIGCIRNRVNDRQRTH